MKNYRVFLVILFVSASGSVATCGAAEEQIATTQQAACMSNEDAGISVPQDGFANEFANGSVWKDPRGRQPDLGNTYWSQISSKDIKGPQKTSSLEPVVWEYTEKLTLNGPQKVMTLSISSSIQIEAKIDQEWPKKDNLSINKITVSDANIYGIDGSGGYQFKEGELTSVKINNDLLWISGKFSLTFEDDHTAETKTIAGAFRGGLIAKCEPGTFDGADPDLCQPYQFLTNAHKKLDGWESKLPPCNDVVDSFGGCSQAIRTIK